jgi:hypothetical protein
VTGVIPVTSRPTPHSRSQNVLIVQELRSSD